MSYYVLFLAGENAQRLLNPIFRALRKRVPSGFPSIAVALLVSVKMATVATAQLLPPDVVYLSKVKIAEIEKSVDLCPVHLFSSDSSLPEFEHQRIRYRRHAKGCEEQFRASPDRFREAANRRRWENNFIRAMVPCGVSCRIKSIPAASANLKS